jgi:nitronate monooxygenase
MFKNQFLQRLGIEIPIIQAPMAGSSDVELAVAVAEAGGLGSIPCAMLTPQQVRAAVEEFRKRSDRPFNLNFFCHTPPTPDEAREQAWRAKLQPYYAEYGIQPDAIATGPVRAPFDEAMCDAVMELKPPVISFHFGLPSPDLLNRVKSIGALILSSATTVEEARWLESAGCDAIIAQGAEAGGHRGMFLASDLSSQAGTMALVPQIVDAVTLPVIASGGIADARGIVAAFVLGASAVQLGTVFLRCPEAKTNPLHRKALESAREDQTALTNLFTGRPARGLMNRFMRETGPVSDLAPAFPLAASAVAPLRAKSEAKGSTDFVPLWAGQAAAFAKEIPAATLVHELYENSLKLWRSLCTE